VASFITITNSVSFVFRAPQHPQQTRKKTCKGSQTRSTFMWLEINV